MKEVMVSADQIEFGWFVPTYGDGVTLTDVATMVPPSNELFVSVARAAEKVAGLLKKEKNVPNLEFAVAACLQQEAVVYGKRGACAQGLLQKIPAARRGPGRESTSRARPAWWTGLVLPCMSLVARIIFPPKAWPMD